MPDTLQLDDMETDLLTELFNIGVGKAAGSLSKMVNQEVHLSVPRVEFRNIAAMAEYLGEKSAVCCVSQEMSGVFDAKSMLLFPAENSMEVVRQLMGSGLSDELITDLQEEALTEIGNIVLNACVGAMGATLEESFELELPLFRVGVPMDLLDSSNSIEKDGVLLIHIDMELSESAVNGYLVFLLSSASQVNLQKCLRVLLDKFNS